MHKWLRDVGLPVMNPLDGLIVAIVDDEVDAVDLLEMVLTGAGARVITASDGRAALERFETSTTRIDLIISDLMMPVVDGFVLLAAVRALPSFRNTPVMALTAGGATIQQRALRAGFDMVHRKPISTEVLTAAILRLVSPLREQR